MQYGASSSDLVTKETYKKLIFLFASLYGAFCIAYTKGVNDGVGH